METPNIGAKSHLQLLDSRERQIVTIERKASALGDHMKALIQMQKPEGHYFDTLSPTDRTTFVTKLKKIR